MKLVLMSEEYEFNEGLKEIGISTLRKQEEGKETESFNVWVDTEGGRCFELHNFKALLSVKETINSINAIPLKELRMVKKPEADYYALIRLGEEAIELLRFSN